MSSTHSIILEGRSLNHRPVADGIVEGHGPEEIETLLQEEREEIAFEERLLQRLGAPRRWNRLSHIIVSLFVAVMMVAMFIQPYIFLLRLFTDFLMYSYDFIILLIPTTTTWLRPEDRGEG